MKKRHLAAIAGAVILAAAITGTIVMADTAGEPAVSQAIDADKGRSGITAEEVMAIYPGYLDSVKAAEKAVVSAEEIMAIYPGYLDSIKVPGKVEFTTGEVMAIYPGFLSSVRTIVTDIEDSPLVPPIYLHP